MGGIPRSTSTTREPRRPISKASGSKKALPTATFGNAMGRCGSLVFKSREWGIPFTA